MFSAVKNLRKLSKATPGTTSSSSLTPRRKISDARPHGVSLGPSGGVSGGAAAPPLGCLASSQEHLKRELWSYVGLLGVFCVYLGVVVGVYALKGLLGPERGAATFCGILLTGFGGMNLFISLNCYRFQRRFKRFSCFADEKRDEHSQPTAPPRPGKEGAKGQARTLGGGTEGKLRPQGQNLVAFLTPEFAKYAEFSARDRRYNSLRTSLIQVPEKRSSARKSLVERKSPQVGAGIGNPSFLFPAVAAAATPTLPEAPKATGKASQASLLKGREASTVPATPTGSLGASSATTSLSAGSPTVKDRNNAFWVGSAISVKQRETAPTILAPAPSQLRITPTPEPTAKLESAIPSCPAAVSSPESSLSKEQQQQQQQKVSSGSSDCQRDSTAGTARSMSSSGSKERFSTAKSQPPSLHSNGSERSGLYQSQQQQQQHRSGSARLGAESRRTSEQTSSRQTSSTKRRQR